MPLLDITDRLKLLARGDNLDLADIVCADAVAEIEKLRIDASKPADCSCARAGFPGSCDNCDMDSGPIKFWREKAHNVAEECAKIAEDQYDEHPQRAPRMDDDGSYEIGWRAACYHIAKKIRPPEEGPAEECNEANDFWARGEHMPGVTR